MGGGLMQLVAYGAQDIYLTGNPQITFFKVVYRRHTNFSMESIEQTFNGTVSFGNRVTATVSRNGDLVHKCYLEVDVTLNANNFPKEHPRCGTSFLFIVMLVSILSYSVIDFFAIKMGLELTIINRLLLHIPCLPIVAGFSYEVLKITAKFQNHLFFRILAFPGILLQKITTKTPNNEQLEVAINALKHAFGDDLKKYEGKQFDADAIG